MELWVIWRERCDEMEAWRRGIVRPPDRPSTNKFIVEIVSVLLITGGIVCELWAGVKITQINGSLRSKGAELRGKSDQLVALLNAKAEGLAKETEDERLARIELQEALAPRRLDKKQQKAVGAALRHFAGQFALMVYPIGDREAEIFANDVWIALIEAGWTATDPGGMITGKEVGRILPKGHALARRN